MRRFLRVFMPMALAAGLVSASTTTAGAEDPSDAYTTVATDLHNPRQMAFGPDGALYVAEAGTGKVNATDQTGGCATGPEGDEVCVGNTSSLTVIEEPNGSSPYAARVANGLLSVADPEGAGAVGLDAVSVTPTGRVYGIITVAPPGTAPTTVADQNGQLIQLHRDGTVVNVADVGGYSLANPLPGHPPDSDPYGVLARFGTVYVTDAANNSLYRVDDGSISTVATFESRPQDDFDGVPTSIAAHDGKLFVGQLSSLEPGKAKITVFDPQGNVLDTIDGLSSVTSVAVARNGDVYATEIFTGEPFNSPGALVKIPADGGPRVVTQLPTPGGVAVDRHDRVYVTINSVSPTDGTVIRLNS